jgi:hypothetical protein
MALSWSCSYVFPSGRLRIPLRLRSARGLTCQIFKLFLLRLIFSHSLMVWPSLSCSPLFVFLSLLFSSNFILGLSVVIDMIKLLILCALGYAVVRYFGNKKVSK